MHRRSLRLGVVVLIALFSLLVVEKFSPRDNNIFSDERIRAERVLNKSQIYPSGVELQGISNFLNSDSFTLSSLVNRNVVLLHFWSYSCASCRRDFMMLNAWNKKYFPEGLIILGVHTPEFSFERSKDLIKEIVASRGIKYPVVLDDDERTWNIYNVKARPGFFLIDVDGFLRYTAEGSGSYDSYDIMESKIQELLSERSEILGLDVINLTRVQVSIPELFLDRNSHKELYVGSEYGRHDFGNPQGLRQGFTINYSLPLNPAHDKVYADGAWLSNADNIELVGSEGKLFLRTSAKKVYITASSSDNSTIEIFDGVLSKKINVKAPILQEIASFENYAFREITISTKDDVRVYKLTLE